MESQPPTEQRDRRQLFGTLLASRPTHTRSPTALALSIAIHITFLGLLVFLSQRYIPQLAERMFGAEEEELVEDAQIIIPIAGGGAGGEPATAQREDDEGREEPPLVFTPGPIAPIPEITPGPETAEPSEGAGGAGDLPKSLADRLRPGTVDPRLRGETRYVLPDASAAEAVRARVGQALRAYNDSVAAETEARRRALDWTIKTKDGKQWGIGPDGKIHLGDITLPAVAFTPPPGRRDEIANRNRDWAEIERQANQEIGRQSFNQRVKAIRARKEKEREEKKKTTENPPITD